MIHFHRWSITSESTSDIRLHLTPKTRLDDSIVRPLAAERRSPTMRVLTTGPVIGPDREMALAFLRTEGYARPIQPADKVFAAWMGSQVVGAVRLAAENGVIVLRGMRVREDHRRRGIGRQLLGRLDDALGAATCWCIPYSWLTAFYATIGFDVADVGEAPAFLVERYGRYVHQGLSVVIMVRRRR